MKVSREWLQTYFDKPIPAAPKLADLFTFHSFEVESVVEREAEKIEKTDRGSRIGDSVLDVKILPDRAHYCLSHLGIAGEIAVLTKVPLRDFKNAGNAKNGEMGHVPVSSDCLPKVTIEASGFCRRFTGRCVENVATGPVSTDSASGKSAEIEKFLEAVGQRAINTIVDATNFVMFDIGQPTHAFDMDKIRGNIVIRAAHAGEKIILLDGKEYALAEGDHVIADLAGALDIAGVKGGKRAEVTSATRNIFITSANFDPSAVRRTSTRLNLRNEASKRFENEITPELAIEAMDGPQSLSVLIAEMYPDAKFGAVIDEYPVKAAQTTISFDPSYVSRRLGVDIPETDCADILARMGIVIAKNAPKAMPKWLLTIPYERLDLTIPDDIVEEIGRIYGYEHIKGRKNSAAATAKVVPPSHLLTEFNFIEKVKDILAGIGFSEVYLYTFAAKGDIEVAHPLAADKSALRTTLALGISKCLETNAKNAELLGLDAIRIFEAGKVFKRKADGSNVESLVLALGAVQVKKVKGVDGKSLITAALEKIREATGITLPVKSLLSSGPNAVCEIELDGLDLGIAAPNPKVADNAADITNAKKITYRQFSLYPFIVRDIAVFVPAESAVRAEDVWAEIEKGVAEADATELLVRHSLFDTFAKDGKISYAFRLIFQSMDRTLTDIEANMIMEKVYAGVVGRNWQVR